VYTEVIGRKYKSQRKVQGGEHATLLPESNLRFVVLSSHPLYGAGPCERKEGLDTLFVSEDKHTKFSVVSTGMEQK